MNLYPATTTDALSQSTKYTYEYSNGKAEKITIQMAALQIMFMTASAGSLKSISQISRVRQRSPPAPRISSAITRLGHMSSRLTISIARPRLIRMIFTMGSIDWRERKDQLKSARHRRRLIWPITLPEILHRKACHISYHFLSSSTSATVSVLVIGGGGGGGGYTAFAGGAGAGGGGGYQYNSSFTVTVYV